MDQSARLSLPYLLPAQAQKHVTHNEALARLDLLVQLAVEGFGAESPPAAPTAGQIWALGPAPTGAWAGHGDEIAAWIDDAWVFVTPAPGWVAADKSGGALRLRGATGWTPLLQSTLDNLDGVGIGTGHDAANRLAVASAATLLSHAGAGHQLKINKAAAADTASLLFQTGFSGRAEMGTAGSDGFAIKVSADGTGWKTALTADAGTGGLRVPSGQTFFEDVFITDDGVWSTAVPWANPARILLWIGMNVAGNFYLVSITGTMTGASNFGPMFVNPAGSLTFLTGPLTGTTGTDGGITLSIDTAGGTPRLYLENRLGSNRLFTLATLGK